MNKSFIVTGASAAGKTTLTNYAIQNGYKYLPTHTTRKIRENETNGINIVFISEKEFIDNFNNNLYFEPSLDYAIQKGLSVYYGTPNDWIDKLKQGNYCGVPSSPIVAREIIKKYPVIWIHLYCDDKDRYNRLKQRGIGEAEIQARMNYGDSIKIPEDATILINTSKYTPEEIIKIIKNM